MFYHLILLLPCTVCLFWAVFLFANRKSNLRSQNILSLAVLMAGFCFLNLANYVAGITDYKTLYILDLIDPSVFIPPVMYLYFRSLTSERRFGWKDYAWFLPSIAVGGVLLLLYAAMGYENALKYTEDLLTSGTLLPQYSDLTYRLHYLISAKLYNWIGLLLLAGICIYALVSIARYHYRLRDFYSVLDDKAINLNYGVLIWFVISTIPGMAIFYLHRDFLEEHRIVSVSIFVSLAVISYGLCYCSYRMKYSVENFASDLVRAGNESYGNEAVSPAGCHATEDAGKIAPPATGKYAKLARQFARLMDEERIFLRCSLRADEVARMMCTNRTYVSRMIREEFDSNFSDCINGRRVGFAKELMRSHPDMKLADVAEASGFINSPTFCRLFRQATGKSPKMWLKEMSEQNFAG